MRTTLDTNEIVTLLRSLQDTVEEGRLKANLLRKQERFQAAQEVLDSLQPVQAILDRITEVWIEVISLQSKLQQPVITISVEILRRELLLSSYY